MNLPAIVVNFKIYENAVGTKGLELAKMLERKANDMNISLGIAVNSLDLRMFCEALDLPIFLQHVDAVEFGAYTGHVIAEMAKDCGATGVLINHSEKRLKLSEISFVTNKCHRIGLEVLVCTDTLESSKAAAALKPTYIAIEPPELIGGDISVSTARPELISETVREIQKISSEVVVMCGAGIKNGDDVRRAIQLGVKGVLVASGVVKAKDPVKALEDLARGLS